MPKAVLRMAPPGLVSPHFPACLSIRRSHLPPDYPSLCSAHPPDTKLNLLSHSPSFS